MLGKILSILLITLGISGAVNHKQFAKMAKELKHNSMVLFLWGIIELTAGLFLVLQHNIWQEWQIIITIFGWLMVIEALVVIMLPRFSVKLTLAWRHANYVLGSSLFAIALGVYLAVMTM